MESKKVADQKDLIELDEFLDPANDEHVKWMLKEFNNNFNSGKCPICGSKLKGIEVTDQEKTDATGEWHTKWLNNICKNHSPIIQFTLEHTIEEQIKGFVEKINDKKITVSHKSKYFLAHKQELGITRY